MFLNIKTIYIPPQQFFLITYFEQNITDGDSWLLTKFQVGSFPTISLKLSSNGSQDFVSGHWGNDELPDETQSYLMVRNNGAL